MKLIRHGIAGREKPGVILDNGAAIDVSDIGQDYTEGFFSGDGLQRLRDWLIDNHSIAPRLAHDVRLGPPVCRPSKIICVGLNYADHAKEGGMEIPTEPILFFKSTTSLIGPNDHVMIPKGAMKVDWEVELALIIGKKASYITSDEAEAHIAGYSLFNDYSERSFQLERGGQWVKGKSCDTFSPLGPFMATRDEIEDPNQLNLWLKVNGVIKQNSNTSNFIFKVSEVVSYISQFMTLLPGDIISTGTPPGVGLGFDPPQYLNPDDVVELGIEKLGSSKQLIKAYSPT